MNAQERIAEKKRRIRARPTPVNQQKTPHGIAPRIPASLGSTPRNTHSQRKSGCGNLLIGLSFILIVIVLFLGFIKGKFDGMIGAIVRSDPRHMVVSDPLQETLPLPNAIRDPFTILLIGVDRRSDYLLEGVRSDTLIVVHVHPEEKWVSMLSIPRDSVAPIPRLGETKINGAYSYGFLNASELYGQGTPPEDGGGALAAEAVEQFLDIPVDYIAQVDFSGFELIVNTLGGVMVDVEQPLLDPEYPTENYGRERLYIPVGLQVLDGQSALRYARSRHSGSDFERSKRQQQVLQATLKEVQSRGLLNQLDLLPQMVSNLEQSIITTLPLDDPSVIYGLAQLARSIGSKDILRLSINPSDVRVVREISSDIYWNKDDLALLVKRFLTGPTEQVGRVQVLNGAGVYGLATRTTTALQSNGLQVLDPGDAPGLYTHTTLIDYTGLPNMRKAIMELARLDESYVYDTPPPNAPPIAPNVDMILILGQDYEDHIIE